MVGTSDAILEIVLLDLVDFVVIQEYKNNL